MYAYNQVKLSKISKINRSKKLSRFMEMITGVSKWQTQPGRQRWQDQSDSSNSAPCTSRDQD